MKDVQNDIASHGIKLSKVGIVNLEYPVRIKRPDRVHEAILQVKVSVDLPKNQKGAHMSRFIEKIEENFSIPQETESVEDLAERIAEEQLKAHKYAKSALVELKAKRDYKKKIYELLGRYDTAGKKKTIGVKVAGTIACPCAIELTGGQSHNQRAILSLEIQTNGNKVNAEHLIEICEQCFSTPLQLMLKRPVERKIVKQMHRNPMFVEDVVRKCVYLLKKKFKGCFCRLNCVSKESIHPFDVFAEWSGVL
jgi:GTP cyclohydrolase FolE2